MLTETHDGSHFKFEMKLTPLMESARLDVTMSVDRVTDRFLSRNFLKYHQDGEVTY